jgi:integrase
MQTRQIYTRKKEHNWQYRPVEGIGVQGKTWKNANEPGPFYINVLLNGTPKWMVLNRDGSIVTKRDMNGLAAQSIPEAIKAAELHDAKQDTKRTAEAQGLSIVPEPGEDNRITLHTAVEHYIQEKVDADRTPGTIRAYRMILDEFLTLLPTNIRYVDQIAETEAKKGGIPKRTSSALKHYMRTLKENGASARTVFNKMSVVSFMLKEAGVEKPSKLVIVPDYEDEEAVPYTRTDLKKLFDNMDADDKFLFFFILDSACRKSEVAHATWNDVYDGKFHVRNKSYNTVGRNAGNKRFTVKTHEDRRIPLTKELLLMIEERRTEGEKKSKWIFPNAAGNPENDNGFIRRLKRVAKQAKLVCGQCHSELKRTDRYGTNPRYEDVCCSKDCQVCEQHYLHRLRKTKATFWHNTGVPIRTIQKWLGHKSLETTMIYLGVKDSEELQTQINAPMF